MSNLCLKKMIDEQIEYRRRASNFVKVTKFCNDFSVQVLVLYQTVYVNSIPWNWKINLTFIYADVM